MSAASVLAAPAEPAPAAADPHAEWRRKLAARMARLRPWAAAVVCAGMALPAVLLLSEPFVASGSVPEVLLALLLGAVFLVPLAGLLMLGIAASYRTAADLRALTAAGLAMMLGIAAIGPAERLGEELWLDVHAAELETGIREVLATEADALRSAAAAPPRGDGVPRTAEELRTAADALLSERLRERLGERGGAAEVHPGFVRLGRGRLYVRTHLPATRELEEAVNCRGVSLRFAGGRWYRYRCTGGSLGE